MYAVLDIEATGGKKGEESIIEIAILKYNGREVIDQFSSLLKPDRSIDAYVQRLTGITPKLVRSAPKFHEVAKRIIEITENCILIGHNISFDYRMLRQEYKKLGYIYKREVIDTIPLSEKLIPNEESYSLGKLSKSLGILVTDRHRAMGDARATLQLFKLLQDKDSLKEINKSVERNKPKKINPKYHDLVNNLPSKTGVYYLLNNKQKIIYLAKSTNIKQSVNDHFTGRSLLSKKIKEQVKSVTYDLTGSYLMAWIKEYNEIKIHQPKNNKSIVEPLSYGLFTGFNRKRYRYIRAQKLNARKGNAIAKYNSLANVKEEVSLVTKEFNLCLKVNKLQKEGTSCIATQVNQCYGACFGKETPEDYNQRVEEFLKVTIVDDNYILVDKGRNSNEKSFFWIKNQQCKGYGYYQYQHQIKSEERIQKIITPIVSDEQINEAVKRHIVTRRIKNIISIKSQ